MDFSCVRVLSCSWFILIQFCAIQSEPTLGLIDAIGSDVGDLVNEVTGDCETIQFCQMNTVIKSVANMSKLFNANKLFFALQFVDEQTQFIIYHKFVPEEHKLTLKCGSKVTIFRCNSKQTFAFNKKVVILGHGICGSSDGFTTSSPDTADRGLAYVMADAGYDVWLLNNRGNFYGDEDLDNWDFSWDDMALEDFPIMLNYIRDKTKQEKFYFIGYSQSTSSMMALLSECPEWNNYFHAKPLAFKLFPRGGTWKMLGSLCKGPMAMLCIPLIQLLVGSNDCGETDPKMLSTYGCLDFSGISACQVQHYGQEAIHGNFGPRLTRSNSIIENFPVHRITAPLQLCYSDNDLVADVLDINKLIPMLNSTAALDLRHIKGLNHLDFVQGVHANDIVYPLIMEFFNKYPC